MSQAPGVILAINAGSSSLKFALYPLQGDGPGVGEALMAGQVEGLERGARGGYAGALAAVRERLTGHAQALAAVAHRVVHGGARYRSSVRVTGAVLRDLETLIPLAPLHQPHNLQGITACAEAFAGVPQVACFDTAFHASLPEVEWRLPIADAHADAGIRRYGFHGLSYQYVMSVLRERSGRAGGRVLMAHLGNGASLCGTLDGASRATTMGFSALDGLMMGTRSGALDPGVLLHWLSEGWNHERIQAELYRRSGLLGVSGIAADMRVLRTSNLPGASRAIELFTERVVRECGAIAGVLGGLDLIAFTGGIGENDAALRAAVCERLTFLGTRIDPTANDNAHTSRAQRISAEDSLVEVWMVPTDEGRVAAGEAAALLRATNE